MNLYREKERVYFTDPRRDLIRLIPSKSENKILEIGAGGGDTLIEIKKQNLANEVVGVDLIEIPDSKQSDPNIDKFIICDVEKADLQLPASYFDVIILGDVLEHLLDPWSFLNKISSFLKKDGIFIASVPNIRYYPACLKIFLKGDFGYEKQGLFDKTHVRFFCKKNIQDLFDTDLFRYSDVIPRQNLYNFKSKKKLLNKLTFGFLEEFLTMQYVIVARKL